MSNPSDYGFPCGDQLSAWHDVTQKLEGQEQYLFDELQHRLKERGLCTNQIKVWALVEAKESLKKESDILY